MQPMPDDRARNARIALAVFVGALGTVLLATGLWFALRPASETVGQTQIEPAQPSEAPGGGSVAATGATSDPGASETTAAVGGEPGSPVASSAQRAHKRAARIAFRLGMSVYVSAEDGSDPQAVARSSQGRYALSPNGAVLAICADTKLHLIAVRSGEVSSGGRVDPTFTPVWAPDSKTVYVAEPESDSGFDRKFLAVSFDGSDREGIGTGQTLALSPDGRMLVVLEGTEPDATGGSIRIAIDGGDAKLVPVGGGVPTAVGATNDRVLVGLSDGARGTAVISIRPDGSDMRQVAGGVPGKIPAFWSVLSVSPDGGVLAAQADGDDGYRRSFVGPLGDTSMTLVDLAGRRDGALHGWSAAGDRVFLIEGNTEQGQATSLASFDRSGTGRRAVVTGAE